MLDALQWRPSRRLRHLTAVSLHNLFDPQAPPGACGAQQAVTKPPGYRYELDTWDVARGAWRLYYRSEELPADHDLDWDRLAFDPESPQALSGVRHRRDVGSLRLRVVAAAPAPPPAASLDPNDAWWTRQAGNGPAAGASGGSAGGADAVEERAASCVGSAAEERGAGVEDCAAPDPAGAWGPAGASASDYAAQLQPRLGRSDGGSSSRGSASEPHATPPRQGGAQAESAQEHPPPPPSPLPPGVCDAGQSQGAGRAVARLVRRVVARVVAGAGEQLQGGQELAADQGSQEGPELVAMPGQAQAHAQQGQQAMTEEPREGVEGLVRRVFSRVARQGQPPTPPLSQQPQQLQEEAVASALVSRVFDRLLGRTPQQAPGPTQPAPSQSAGAHGPACVTLCGSCNACRAAAATDGSAASPWGLDAAPGLARCSSRGSSRSPSPSRSHSGGGSISGSGSGSGSSCSVDSEPSGSSSSQRVGPGPHDGPDTHAAAPAAPAHEGWATAVPTAVTAAAIKEDGAAGRSALQELEAAAVDAVAETEAEAAVPLLPGRVVAEYVFQLRQLVPLEPRALQRLWAANLPIFTLAPDRRPHTLRSALPPPPAPPPPPPPPPVAWPPAAASGPGGRGGVPAMAPGAGFGGKPPRRVPSAVAAPGGSLGSLAEATGEAAAADKRALLRWLLSGSSIVQPLQAQGSLEEELAEDAALAAAAAAQQQGRSGGGSRGVSASGGLGSGPAGFGGAGAGGGSGAGGEVVSGEGTGGGGGGGGGWGAGRGLHHGRLSAEDAAALLDPGPAPGFIPGAMAVLFNRQELPRGSSAASTNRLGLGLGLGLCLGGSQASRSTASLPASPLPIAAAVNNIVPALPPRGPSPLLPPLLAPSRRGGGAMSVSSSASDLLQHAQYEHGTAAHQPAVQRLPYSAGASYDNLLSAAAAHGGGAGLASYMFGGSPSPGQSLSGAAQAQEPSLNAMGGAALSSLPVARAGSPPPRPHSTGPLLSSRGGWPGGDGPTLDGLPAPPFLAPAAPSDGASLASSSGSPVVGAAPPRPGHGHRRSLTALPFGAASKAFSDPSLALAAQQTPLPNRSEGQTWASAAGALAAGGPGLGAGGAGGGPGVRRRGAGVLPHSASQPAGVQRLCDVPEVRASIRRLTHLQERLHDARSAARSVRLRLEAVAGARGRSDQLEDAAQRTRAERDGWAARAEEAARAGQALRAAVAQRRRALAERAGALRHAASVLQTSEERRLRAEAQLEGPEGRGRLAALTAALVARRSAMVAELGRIYQIEPVSEALLEPDPLDLTLESSWAGAAEPSPREEQEQADAAQAAAAAAAARLPASARAVVVSGAGAGGGAPRPMRLAVMGLEVPPDLVRRCLQGPTNWSPLDLGRAYDADQRTAASLGYLAAVLNLAASYLAVPLRYPVAPRVSVSYISDPVPPSVAVRSGMGGYGNGWGGSCGAQGYAPAIGIPAAPNAPMPMQHSPSSQHAAAAAAATAPGGEWRLLSLATGSLNAAAAPAPPPPAPPPAVGLIPGPRGVGTAGRLAVFSSLLNYALDPRVAATPAGALGEDAHPQGLNPSAGLPLFWGDGARDRTRFAYAVHLLCKDVEQLLGALGIPPVAPEQPLQNLYVLVSAAAAATAAAGRGAGGAGQGGGRGGGRG
ncbi:hypothetical protein HYH03_001482 [Edaphochlamys debaryana]|uniref:Uncharacterized protein n=1 Tax=Edaphochlamys debaryana TaxID=47281 RepID=A0A835YD22_9CHLO|nr:hypothetical protein HYH03_001482 [Edaphochlamys debaryana]|eukprot:KAG2500717.1 hypothetical protein HYH03_001482 [Edaphochlamys debaryana]